VIDDVEGGGTVWVRGCAATDAARSVGSMVRARVSTATAVTRSGGVGPIWARAVSVAVTASEACNPADEPNPELMTVTHCNGAVAFAPRRIAAVADAATVRTVSAGTEC